MTDNAVALREEPSLTPFEAMEAVLTKGDLAQMTPDQRIAFYWRTCESLGLNPLTRPFEFIVLNGKMTMYARKDATDQLRKINAVSVTSIRREKDDDLGLLTVYAAGRDRTGREDEATGVVTIKGLSGEALANAAMKAETKAKRRLTLSLVGLGFLDESEIDSRGDVDVDPTTGVVTERAKPKTLLEAVRLEQERLTESADPGSTPEADAGVDPGSRVVAPESAETEAEILAQVQEGEVTQIARVLTQEELFDALTEHHIAKSYASQVAEALFPDRPKKTPLTGEQRGILLDSLLADL